MPAPGDGADAHACGPGVPRFALGFPFAGLERGKGVDLL